MDRRDKPGDDGEDELSMTDTNEAVLQRLYTTIAARKTADPGSS